MGMCWVKKPAAQLNTSGCGTWVPGIKLQKGELLRFADIGRKGFSMEWEASYTCAVSQFLLTKTGYQTESQVLPIQPKHVACLLSGTGCEYELYFGSPLSYADNVLI